MDRVKNVGRNALWGIISQIVMLGFPFIIRTIIIRTLGNEYLGLSSLFTSILQVLNLTELGFSSAIVYSLYKPIIENDVDSVNALLAFFRKVYAIIGGIILAVGLVLIPWLGAFIKKDIPADINIQILYIIYLINTSASYILFAYKECVLVANQRKDILSKISTITKIVMYVFQVYILVVLKNFYLYVAVMPVLIITYSCLISVAVSRLYPQYKKKGNITEEQKQSIKTQVSGLMISKIAATTRNSFDNIIISSAIGLVAVTLYGNYYYIISSLQAIILILANSLQPGIGNCVATESIDKNYKDYRNFLFIYSWISGFCTVCLFTLYQPFMIIWVGDQNTLSNWIVILCTIYFYLLTMGDISSLYINASGIWWNYRIKSVVESISNLIMNIVLVHYFGIVGIIIATLVTRFVCGIIWGNLILYRSYFGKNRTMKFYKDYFLYSLIVALSIGLIICIDKVLGRSSNELYVLKLLTCIIVPNLLYYFIYRKQDRYQTMMHYCSHLISIVLKGRKI